MSIPTVAPHLGRRVDLTEWSHREPVRTLTGTIHTLTRYTLTLLVEADGSRRSYFLEDVTIYEPWDERNNS